jgi:hypothetical protein
MSAYAKSRLLTVALVVAGMSIISTGAWAQTPSAPDAKGCTPQEQANKALQDTGKTSGTICPPDVDPAMKAPTPSTGDGSVIPPPGTPGGAPAPQAK